MAKYSFNMTLGQMLSTPEIKALIDEIMPTILQHPWLNEGMGYYFSDCVPYILNGWATQEQIDAFAAKLETLV